QAWDAYVTHQFRHKKARKRRYGGGRKPHLLAIADKLFFILFDFKVYPLLSFCKLGRLSYSGWHLSGSNPSANRAGRIPSWRPLSTFRPW
ncbi:MAG TPA: hypothetical protein VE844_03915, partial [Gammaproteobacteria bacterium]|nr:hypothetical protein [Gammaproteobacteria bacterium]